MTEDLIVSLDEFADLVGVTTETMRAHLKTVDGSPAWLVERGDRGRAYKIAAKGAVEWWATKREADEAASEDRRAQLAQLRFDMVGGQVEASEQLRLSGRQRREEYEAAFKALEYRKRMGQLLEKGDVDHALTHAAVDLRRRLLLIPGEFRIASGLSADEVRPLERLMRGAVDKFLLAIATAATVSVPDAD